MKKNRGSSWQASQTDSIRQDGERVRGQWADNVRIGLASRRDRPEAGPSGPVGGRPSQVADLSETLSNSPFQPLTKPHALEIERSSTSGVTFPQTPIGMKCAQAELDRVKAITNRLRQSAQPQQMSALF